MTELVQIAQAIDTMGNAFETYKAKQDRRFEELETRLRRPGAGAFEHKGNDYHPDRDKALATVATPEQRQALGRWLRNGDQKAFDLAARIETKGPQLTATVGSDADSVIPWLAPTIQSQSISNSELLRRVRRVAVANFPAKVIVTSAAGFEWVGDNDTRNQTNTPTPHVIEIPGAEWSAKPQATNWALADQAFDVQAWLMAELSLTYANGLMNAICTGDGTNKPLGIVGAPTSASASPPLGTIRRFASGFASTLPTTAAGMLTLLQSVSGSLGWQYRDGAAWFMTNATLQVIRSVRDLQDRPLFLDSAVQAGQNSLLGHPVVEVEAMPEIGANSFPIVFGNVDLGYTLATAGGMQMTRDEITSPGYTKFYTRQRVSGRPTDTAALRVVRVSAT